MLRRSFLKSLGITTATVAAVSSDVFADTPEAGSRPQFSDVSHQRLQIASANLSAWVPSASQPWDVHTINHLYRRAGFGVTLSEIEILKKITPSQAVDDLLDDALLAAPHLPPDPTYSNRWMQVTPYIGTDLFQTARQETENKNGKMEIRRHWTVLMFQPKTMLREKLAVFWMNHFVIESNKVVYPHSIYLYLKYFRENAWGNFKDMVSEISTTSAMLVYLDGILNEGSSPNENYARELQELFTMGVVDKDGKPNYSQADVEGIAHSLTGWKVDVSAAAPNVLPAVYHDELHDPSKQMIYDGVARKYNLKASGASMEKDLIDHIFDQRGDQIAWNICAKLYQYFVYHDISSDASRSVIGLLADTFKKNWSVKEVLSLLFKSAHFFDEGNIGALIKSPYDHIVSFLRSFDVILPLNNPAREGELSAGTLYYYALDESQELLSPPNVKGWPGNHTWISTTTLPYRNAYIQTSLLISGNLAPFGVDGYGQNHLPVFLLDGQITTWGEQFANYNGTFDDLLNEMATYLCAHLPTATALKYVKGKMPPNTYEWAGLSDKDKLSGLRHMANEIMLLADYQLC